jgi:phage terminase large subunit-like protein
MTLEADPLPQYDWLKVARPAQLPPDGDWKVWLIMAGRGFGKTRTGAETIRQWVMEGRYRRIALIADTATEARNIMIEGDSGLLAVHSPDEMPKYEPSKRRVTWPNGAVATVFTAENSEQLRGAQFECAWIDEFAKFRCALELWQQMNFCLRVGPDPRAIVTTTPRRISMMHQLLEAEGDWVTVTRGTTFDNAANLSPHFIKHVQQLYKGTSLGRQELYGEMLPDVEGALWNYKMIEEAKVRTVPELRRVVVAVDPAATSTKSSDETGIIVAGICALGNAYILKDLSGKYTPNAWAKQAVAAYHAHNADRIVAEGNQGGDMVQTIIHKDHPTIPYTKVTATRDKVLRAEPVLALYEQRRVFHVQTGLEKLEEQMCTYVPLESKKSPDRLDAMVWAITELLLSKPPSNIPRVWIDKQGP